LADLAGVEQVRAITEAAMNAKLILESFKQRMALLEGLEEVLQVSLKIYH
jgi:phosphoserine phosphatase